MKTIIISLTLTIAVLFSVNSTKTTELNDYIIIAWNDLGMHCSNKDFSTMVILPPYNTLLAQVIKRGSDNSMPEVITEGIRVTYEIPGNTYSVGKTNFWDYEDKLFGTELEDNIGLKGAGLSGEMSVVDNHFIVEGIPVTPYTDNDLVNEDPYQQALVKVYDLEGNLLATTKPVIPVSNEISCVSSGCHSSEQGILNHHEDEGGFNPNNKPILCASCHASNALGTKGNSEAKPLSQRIHSKHASRTSDCYKCHPGNKTRCFRDAMYSAGKECKDCHGTLSQIASSISSGRRPWLDEPSCSMAGCHNESFAPNSGKLFKDSKGHGAMYCSACHGSPHAIYPTEQERDNEQMIALQGYPGKLSECWVCHGKDISGIGPHGITHTDVKETYRNNDIKIYPNPAQDYIIVKSEYLAKDIQIISMTGKTMEIHSNMKILNQNEVKINISKFVNGLYIIKTGNRTKKFTKS